MRIHSIEASTSAAIFIRYSTVSIKITYVELFNYKNVVNPSDGLNKMSDWSWWENGRLCKFALTWFHLSFLSLLIYELMLNGAITSASFELIFKKRSLVVVQGEGPTSCYRILDCVGACAIKDRKSELKRKKI